MTTRVTRVMNERIAHEVAIGNAPVAYLGELPNEGTKVTRNNANNFIFPLLPYRRHITNYNSYTYVDSNWNKSNK
jgi:hypothetical protein